MYKDFFAQTVINTLTIMQTVSVVRSQVIKLIFVIISFLKYSCNPLCKVWRVSWYLHLTLLYPTLNKTPDITQSDRKSENNGAGNAKPAFSLPRIILGEVY